MSDAGIYRALPVSDGEDGDSDAAVRVDLTDPAAAAEEEVEENSEAEQDDEAYSTSPRRCTLRIAILCGVLAPLITLLAVAGLLALVSLLASIRSQCNSGGGWQGGRQWQCWRRTAISQWVPQTLFASPSPTSLSSSPLPVNFSWTPESSPPSLNAIRLARVFDRLERGLPIVVGGIGGSNLQGGRLNWTQTVLPVLTAWLNEHFPVNTTDTQALEADRLVSLQRDCGSQMSRGPTMMEHAPPRHVFFNAAVGGTTSGVTSFCYRRLIPQCEFLQGVYSDADSWSYHDPDLLLVDFAVNDIIDDDPFTASPPAKNIERLVRQVLGHTSHTALVMVYFAVLLSEGLHNGEHIHHAVAERYQLPEVSIRKFSLDWLYEPRYERDAFKKVPDLKVQRPVPLSLPLPLVEAMKTLNAGQRVNMDSLFWMNGYHLNELGHRILAALLSRELLTLHHSLRSNHYTSFADPVQLPAGLSASLPSLLEPSTVQSAVLPPPLNPSLARDDAQQFVCTVMYYPYNKWADQLNQLQAEGFMSIDRNQGWQYTRHGQTNKFAMVVPQAEVELVGRPYMRMALPSAIHSLLAVFVRSWNVSQMGEATMWLSCDKQEQNASAPLPLPLTVPTSASSRCTAPVRLNGSWPQSSTQLDLLQIWPLDSEPTPDCDLRFGHVLHTRPGEFRFVGVVWN